LVRVEIAIGFDAGRLLQLAKVSRPAVRQAIGMRPFVVLPAFRPLTRGPQIDQFSHRLSSAVTGYIRAMLDANSMPIRRHSAVKHLRDEGTRIYKMAPTKMQQLP
jgi:hypothetical protein